MASREIVFEGNLQASSAREGMAGENLMREDNKKSLNNRDRSSSPVA